MGNEGYKSVIGSSHFTQVLLPIFVQVYSISIEHFKGVFSAVDTAFFCIIDML